MKIRYFVILLALAMAPLLTQAAWFSFLPHTVRQPDGMTISCYVSGDEFFNWLHDQNGYTIIQAPDGYFYYGSVSGDLVVPTSFRAGTIDPLQAGLEPWAKISLAEYNRRKDFYRQHEDDGSDAPHLGTMNNLVVYIRFNDDTEFTTTRQAYDNKFNPETGKTLKSYYQEVSYNLFTISSSHYPECPMTVNLSYQDYHDRNYFEPYNATTNPGGYNGNSERTFREHTLLKEAINWINANSPVPADLEIDGDNDGRVDNVCFIIRGGNGAWADLLWAHRWSLYSQTVHINGKRVYDYTFQPESQVDVNTLCHEMFHALGAPDLYHYTHNGISPASSWDIMDGGTGHMTAYMKWKYADASWITEIPEIVTSGTYTLRPLTSPTNNCYRIASPNSSSEFFVVEYRKKAGTFETSLPGSGLIVYRIDPSVNGNASGPPDELYVYRPGGTTTSNGSPGSAFFSSQSGRTAINDGTNPSPFLQNGSPGGLNISAVTVADSTISFTVNLTNIQDPSLFAAAPVSTERIRVEWEQHPSVPEVMLAYSASGSFGSPAGDTIYSPGDTIPGGGVVLYQGQDTVFNHSGLSVNTRYFYKIWSVAAGPAYSMGLETEASTLCHALSTLPFAEGFELQPSRPDCWGEDNPSLRWQFVKGNGSGSAAGYPPNAHSGNLNACLMDETLGDNLSMLISPVFDLTLYDNVTMKFWMFMQRWGSRQDELSVWYRLSPDSAWIEAEHFDQSVTAWTEKTISFPATSAFFQFAFAGNAKFGLGICIDDVELNGEFINMLNVSPLNQNVSRVAGEVTFNVECMTGWSAVSSDTTWCRVTGDGAGNGNLVTTYTQNPLGQQRIASITVTTQGLPPQVVTVTQAAANIGMDGQPALSVLVYPNPASDVVRISATGTGQGLLRVELTDLMGHILRSATFNGQDAQLRLDGLGQGCYLIRVTTSQGTVTRKLSVNR